MAAIDWERVARAHLNATRLVVLETIAAAAGPVSAAGVARTPDRPVNEVAYHVSELARKGVIVVHSTARSRGGRETFYVLA